MKIKTLVNLVSIILIVWIHSTRVPISCNPIAFSPPTAPPMTMAIPPMPLPAPMIMGSQFDPFVAPIQATPYILTPSFGQMPPFDADRRSISSFFKPSERKNKGNKKDHHQQNQDSNESDEQKALGDLPVSFIEPEGPSTISERISDSFSALGEGVRNHFRSMTENFSDTMDDLKDAWRWSDNSKKRG